MIILEDIKRMDSVSLAEIQKIIIEHDKIEEDILKTVRDDHHPEDWETAAYIVSKRYDNDTKIWEIMRQLCAQAYQTN